MLSLLLRRFESRNQPKKRKSVLPRVAPLQFCADEAVLFCLEQPAGGGSSGPNNARIEAHQEALLPFQFGPQFFSERRLFGQRQFRLVAVLDGHPCSQCSHIGENATVTRAEFFGTCHAHECGSIAHNLIRVRELWRVWTGGIWSGGILSRCDHAG